MWNDPSMDTASDQKQPSNDISKRPNMVSGHKEFQMHNENKPLSICNHPIKPGSETGASITYSVNLPYTLNIARTSSSNHSLNSADTFTDGKQTSLDAPKLHSESLSNDLKINDSSETEVEANCKSRKSLDNNSLTTILNDRTRFSKSRAENLNDIETMRNSSSKIKENPICLNGQLWDTYLHRKLELPDGAPRVLLVRLERIDHLLQSQETQDYSSENKESNSLPPNKSDGKTATVNLNLESNKARKEHSLISGSTFNTLLNSKWSADCVVCKKTFVDRLELHKHATLSHSDKQILFCNFCGKTFVYKKRLQNHRIACNFRSQHQKNSTPINGRRKRKCRWTFKKATKRLSDINVKRIHNVKLPLPVALQTLLNEDKNPAQTEISRREAFEGQTNLNSGESTKGIIPSSNQMECNVQIANKNWDSSEYIKKRYINKFEHSLHKRDNLTEYLLIKRARKQKLSVKRDIREENEIDEELNVDDPRTGDGFNEKTSTTDNSHVQNVTKITETIVSPLRPKNDVNDKVKITEKLNDEGQRIECNDESEDNGEINVTDLKTSDNDLDEESPAINNAVAEDVSPVTETIRPSSNQGDAFNAKTVVMKELIVPLIKLEGSFLRELLSHGTQGATDSKSPVRTDNQQDSNCKRDESNANRAKMLQSDVSREPNLENENNWASTNSIPELRTHEGLEMETLEAISKSSDDHVDAEIKETPPRNDESIIKTGESEEMLTDQDVITNTKTVRENEMETNERSCADRVMFDSNTGTVQEQEHDKESSKKPVTLIHIVKDEILHQFIKDPNIKTQRRTDSHSKGVEGTNPPQLSTEENAEKEKPKWCKTCNAGVFRLIHELREYRKWNDRAEGQGDPIKCPYCSMYFVSLYYLYWHLAHTHTRCECKHPSKIDIDNKRKKIKETKRAELDTNTLSEGKRPSEVLKDVEKEVQDSEELQQTVQAHKGRRTRQTEKTDSDDARVVKCRYCCERFPTIQAFRMHSRVSHAKPIKAKRKRRKLNNPKNTSVDCLKFNTDKSKLKEGEVMDDLMRERIIDNTSSEDDWEMIASDDSSKANPTIDHSKTNDDEPEAKIKKLTDELENSRNNINGINNENLKTNEDKNLYAINAPLKSSKKLARLPKQNQTPEIANASQCIADSTSPEVKNITGSKNLVESAQPCSFCKEVFSTKRDLAIHQSVTHPLRYPLICDVCFRGFKQEPKLTKHKLVHQYSKGSTNKDTSTLFKKPITPEVITEKIDSRLDFSTLGNRKEYVNKRAKNHVMASADKPSNELQKTTIAIATETALEKCKNKHDYVKPNTNASSKTLRETISFNEEKMTIVQCKKCYRNFLSQKALNEHMFFFHRNFLKEAVVINQHNVKLKENRQEINPSRKTMPKTTVSTTSIPTKCSRRKWFGKTTEKNDSSSVSNWVHSPWECNTINTSTEAIPQKKSVESTATNGQCTQKTCKMTIKNASSSDKSDNTAINESTPECNKSTLSKNTASQGNTKHHVKNDNRNNIQSTKNEEISTEAMLNGHNMETSEISATEDINGSARLDKGYISNNDRMIFSCKHCKKKYSSRKALGEHMFYLHDDFISETEVVTGQASNSAENSNSPSQFNVFTPSTKKMSTSKYYEQEVETLALQQESNDLQQITPWKGVWTCNLCDESFPVMRRYILHRYHSHNDQSSVHVCDNCEKVLTSIEMVNAHLCTKVTSWSCRRCTKSFPTAVALRFHNKELHMEKLGLYTCTTCEREFMTIGMLDRHKRTLHSSLVDTSISSRENDLNANQPNSIESNNVSVSEMNDIDKLSRKDDVYSTDADDEESQCNLCKENFSSSINLRCHITTSHPSATEMCQFCREMYRYADLARHILIHHFSWDNSMRNKDESQSGKEMELTLQDDYTIISKLGEKQILSLCEYNVFDDDQDIWVCPFCPKLFLNNRHFKIHRLWRHDNFCALCNVAFKSSYEAAKHKGVAHGSVASYLWMIEALVDIIVKSKKYGDNAQKIVFDIISREAQCYHKRDKKDDELLQWKDDEFLGGKTKEFKETNCLSNAELLDESSIYENVARNEEIDTDNVLGDEKDSEVNLDDLTKVEVGTVGEHHDLDGAKVLLVITEEDVANSHGDINTLASNICSTCPTIPIEEVKQLLVECAENMSIAENVENNDYEKMDQGT